MTYEKFVRKVAEVKEVELDDALRKDLASMTRKFVLATAPVALTLGVLGSAAFIKARFLVSFLAIAFYLFFVSTFYTAMAEDMDMLESCKKFVKFWWLIAILCMGACIVIRLFLW